MAPRASAPAAPPPTRPRVALLYTHASPLTREGEYIAKYIGLTMASTGGVSKAAVVGVSLEPTASTTTDPAETAVLRADGKVYRQSQVSGYVETTDVRVLRDCHVWILCLDTATAFTAIQFLQKRIAGATSAKDDKPTPKKRIILSLQPALRQLRELENAFPKDTVLHGGACFHLTLNKHGVLYPLSHGCYFIERLAADKTNALYLLDLLEATGFELLSRKNTQAMKWGHSMLRLFYYVNALTGQSVRESLRDRATRLVYLQLLHEVNSVFALVALDLQQQDAKSSGWTPDCSAATYLSIYAIMVLLPLPDWLFNGVVSRVVDFGLASSTTGVSSIQRDVEMHLETEFWSEFKDVFDLAARRTVELPGLATLRDTLATLAQRRQKTPALSGRGLLSEIPSSVQSRAVSRSFFLKFIITIVTTSALLGYLFS